MITPIRGRKPVNHILHTVTLDKLKDDNPDKGTETLNEADYAKTVEQVER